MTPVYVIALWAICATFFCWALLVTVALSNRGSGIKRKEIPWLHAARESAPSDSQPPLGARERRHRFAPSGNHH